MWRHNLVHDFDQLLADHALACSDGNYPELILAGDARLLRLDSVGTK
ncbi:MAG: hypothetical protein R3F27_03485 [Gammaproteobacteria bacterium]